MDLISFVTLSGGAMDRATLLRTRGRREVDRALSDGTLVQTRRGHYALATTPQQIRLASSVGGVLSHRTAAAHWGWAQKMPPRRVELTVPRTQRLLPGARRVLIPHWSDLRDDDIVGMVTSPERTLVDCMRNLPLDQSLPIVDSALRVGDFSSAAVRLLAEGTRGRGRQRIRDVARDASRRPANAFESVLRAQAYLVTGLAVQPQYAVRVPGSDLVLHPDLADPARKMAIEAEGFDWHGDRTQLTGDCRRYNLLTVRGWIEIRFSWDQVMFEPAYVQQVLTRATQHAAAGRANHTWSSGA